MRAAGASGGGGRQRGRRAGGRFHSRRRRSARRFVRILLETSSDTAPPGSADPRDAIGMRSEKSAWVSADADGRLVDSVRPRAPPRWADLDLRLLDDPWHRATDRDDDLEQPGFDRVFASGLTRDQPMMFRWAPSTTRPKTPPPRSAFSRPATTPSARSNSARNPTARTSTPRTSGPLPGVRRRLHRVDPTLRLGWSQSAAGDRRHLARPQPGPLLDPPLHPLPDGRGRLGALNFFTFEYYPFDDLCGP